MTRRMRRSPPAARSDIPALFLLFGSMGASSATIPAVIPAIAADRTGALADYLGAVPVLFLGLLIGVLLSSAVGALLSPRRLALGGSVIQAVGFAGSALAASPVAFVTLAFIVGIGFGLVEASASVLARAAAGANTARLLSALTGTVAVVAAGVPLLVALTALGRTPSVVFLLVAAVHLVGMVVVARFAESGAPAEAIVAAPSGSTPRSAGIVVVITATGAALALYVGVETVYAGWSSSIPLLALGVSAQQAAIGTSVFWALLAIGRYVAAVVLRGPISPLRYLVVSTSVATIALLVTAGTVEEHPILAVIALAVAVAALGPCYSLILGTGLSRLPVARARWATGLLVACGAGGGALVPAVILVTADGPTSPAVFAVTGALTVASGLLSAWNCAGSRRRRSGGAPRPTTRSRLERHR